MLLIYCIKYFYEESGLFYVSKMLYLVVSKIC